MGSNGRELADELAVFQESSRTVSRDVGSDGDCVGGGVGCGDDDCV